MTSRKEILWYLRILSAAWLAVAGCRPDSSAQVSSGAAVESNLQPVDAFISLVTAALGDQAGSGTQFTEPPAETVASAIRRTWQKKGADELTPPLFANLVETCFRSALDLAQRAPSLTSRRAIKGACRKAAFQFGKTKSEMFLSPGSDPWFLAATLGCLIPFKSAESSADRREVVRDLLKDSARDFDRQHLLAGLMLVFDKEDLEFFLRDREIAALIRSAPMDSRMVGDIIATSGKLFPPIIPADVVTSRKNIAMLNPAWMDVTSRSVTVEECLDVDLRPSHVRCRARMRVTPALKAGEPCRLRFKSGSGRDRERSCPPDGVITIDEAVQSSSGKILIEVISGADVVGTATNTVQDRSIQFGKSTVIAVPPAQRNGLHSSARAMPFHIANDTFLVNFIEPTGRPTLFTLRGTKPGNMVLDPTRHPFIELCCWGPTALVKNNLYYSVGQHNGLYILDVRDPSNAFKIFASPLWHQSGFEKFYPLIRDTPMLSYVSARVKSQGIALADNYAYISYSGTKNPNFTELYFSVIDVSDPASAKPITHFSIDRAYDVANIFATDSIVFWLSEAAETLLVIDARTASAPRIAAALPIPGLGTYPGTYLETNHFLGRVFHNSRAVAVIRNKRRLLYVPV